jgi:anti-sigma factor ChrR (cupin superfamily)
MLGRIAQGGSRMRQGATMHPVNVEKQLEDLILGHLASDELAELEEHLQGCEVCTRRRAELEAACADLALALPPKAGRPALRSRLFSAVDHLERFTPMAPRLAEILDIPPNEARLSLHALERPEALPPVIPGMRASRLPTGPRLRNAEAVLACLSPGAGLPRHRHRGEECVLVFQGSFITDDGRVARAGEELWSPPGSVHAIARILGDEPCLCAIVNDEGFEVVP